MAAEANTTFPPNDITTIVSDDIAKVIEVHLDGENGRLYFSNGVLLDFTTKTLGLVSAYKCVYSVRISSKEASQGHIRCVSSSDQKFYPWQTVLKDAGRINFHGSWDPIVLTHFIKCAPKLVVSSFTHWSCSNPKMTIAALPKNLFELSMHVTVGQFEEVVYAIGDRSDSMAASIGRIILVCEDTLIRDPIQMFSQATAKVLVDNAHVILLFGGEDSGTCLKVCARELDLVYDNHIRLAKNSLYSDETPQKQYHTYEVYSKVDDDVLWRIGSLIGTVRKVEPKHFKPKKVTHVKGSQKLSLPYNVESDEMFFTQEEDGIIDKSIYPFRVNLWRYENIDSRSLSPSCCQPKPPMSLSDADMSVDNEIKVFKIPGWITTQIQKVIYHEHLTEFLASNGFYMILDEMKDEPKAFNVLITTTRFIFHCTSSLRRCFHVENIQYFLRNAVHIEFMGKWFTKPLSDIGQRFNIGLRRLTMVRIELHGKPLRYIFNDIPIEIKRNLQAFHFDGRGTRDGSIASIVNGLRFCINPVMKFDELLIIGNHLEWFKDSYKCRLGLHYSDMDVLLTSNGCATTVIAGSVTPEQVDAADHFDLGENSNASNALASPVLVPIAYPHTLRPVSGLTKLCRGYRRVFRQKHLYLVCRYELLPPDSRNIRRL